MPVQLGPERPRFSPVLDDPLPFPPGDVEEYPGLPQRVGPGTRPVDVAQPVRGAVGPLLEHRVAVGVEPGVDVEAALVSWRANSGRRE
jgi:hypothetical protein